MKKLGTYFVLLVLAICCMTGVSFAGDSIQPMEPAPGYVIAKESMYTYGGSGSDADKDLQYFTCFSYEFDKSGNITYKKLTDDQLNGNVYTVEETYRYDDAGNVISYALTGINGGQEQTQYTYDVNNNLIKEVTINSFDYETVCVKTYDENGKLIREETTDNEDNPSSSVILYTYNTDGLLETVKNTNKYTANSTTVYVDHYTYNTQGLVSKQESLTIENNAEVYKCINNYSYDVHGNILTEAISEYNHGQHEYETIKEYAYNENNLCTQVSFKRWNSYDDSKNEELHDAETITYEYDNNQNNTCITLTYDGIKQKCLICEYEKIPNYDSSDSPFVDVQNTNDYFYTPVLWAVENNITYGTDDTHFLPNQSCTRAQVVAFLWRAMGSPAPTTTECPFVDVKSSDYFYNAILWAVENGITYGTDDTHFSPNATVTRADFVTFLWRAEKRPSYNVQSTFVDIPANSYYAGAVLWAAENKVAYGVDDTHFAPAQFCTRGQVVSFLYRADR